MDAKLNSRHDAAAWALPASPAHRRHALLLRREWPTIDGVIAWASAVVLVCLAIARYFGWMPWV